MLAELAACNVAFGIISQAVKNGAEISSCAKSISDFTLNKDAIQKKASQKGGNADGRNNDLEEFLALDELKLKEEQLRRKRQEAAAEERRKQIKLQETLSEAVMWIVTLSLCSVVLMGFAYILWRAN